MDMTSLNPPFAHGEYTDISLGQQTADEGNKVVVIKTFRLTGSRPASLWEALWEALQSYLDQSKHLNHPNIGIPYNSTFKSGQALPAIILPYYHGRNLIVHMKQTRVSPEERNYWILNILAGVQYLHEHGIIHGNIRGSNIFVDEGRALLADHCLNTLMRHHILDGAIPHSWRWKSREQLIPVDNEIPMPTKESDIYSLGRTIQEIYTLKFPFPDIRYVAKLLVKMKNGKVNNENPGGIPPAVWAALRRCFADRPEERPSIEELRTRLLGTWANNEGF